MTPDQQALVSATVGVLKEHGVALTTHFYRRMFEHNPELKNVFNMGNQQNGKQQMALALAVLAYAEHIADPSVLLPAVTKIGHKHVSLDIRPEHYAIVGRHLLASIGEVLGAAATPELLDAWAAAYGELAALMSGLENGLYRDAVAQTGGWTGWRPFTVKRKVMESAEITSFYLYPTDGGAVADFQPGQYVSLRLFLPELNLFQPRQYSLSCAPNGEYYRISVKREAGAPQHPDGMISNRLHAFVQEGDVLELAAPAGDFALDTRKQTPVVLVSGGVGQTPLLSMLEHLVATGSPREIVWVHGSRNPEVHAFREPVAQLAERHANVQRHIFYDAPAPEQLGQGHYQGIVDLQKLDGGSQLPEAEYYLCGPVPFIRKQVQDLQALGVPRAAIHFEEFGPATLSL
ncbi:NO-inducible flavohemoprotein [Hymenobacter sp. 15J16-1T3B]|uniref:NO-inducible flavohemoprotein n=1 Tax=Hymenobacter sp. 15J16-1T3B TaxID=2886941 RepID=UPI001D1008F1|nr:NO-inducible flavohemoprotein [Hymenobacter sp. 15J16-1T3B]MCC3157359.1 NO-inducible flavohemoprotein [Hymenobacter sp. 15J16-1T3B]